MELKENLARAVQQAIEQLYQVQIPLTAFSLQETKKTFAGSHSLQLFSLAAWIERIKKADKEFGEALGRWLLQKKSSLVAEYQVLNGFLNLTLTDQTWLTELRNLDQKPSPVKNPQKIVLEIACPNTNKPLHLGHLRNSFIGDAVANILAFVGHDVKKVIHINDRGIHICKSMFAYQQDPNPKTPQESNIKGDHLVGEYYVRFEQMYKKQLETLTEQLGNPEKAKTQVPCMQTIQRMLQEWEQGVPEVMKLWQTMNNWVYEGFRQTYKALNISFDKRYYESETYLLGKDIVKEGLKKNLFYKKKDSSIWVDLASEGLGEKLLLRSDGTAVYMTQDLGTADLRAKDFQADRYIYVVGNEQNHHFSVLFAILKKMQRPYAHNLFHLAYALVDLPSGRMKSREGTVVDADDLIREMRCMAKGQTTQLGKIDDLSPQEAEKLYQILAVGALKFFLLKVSPQKGMCFDPNKSIDFQGHTGPFIQYTHARICTMLKKADRAGLRYKELNDTPIALSTPEKELISYIVRFHSLVHEAARLLNPSIIAQYGHALAKTYNQFYAQLPILRASDPQLQKNRLHISYCTLKVLREFGILLGIEMPEKM